MPPGIDASGIRPQIHADHRPQRLLIIGLPAGYQQATSRLPASYQLDSLCEIRCSKPLPTQLARSLGLGPTGGLPLLNPGRVRITQRPGHHRQGGRENGNGGLKLPERISVLRWNPLQQPAHEEEIREGRRRSSRVSSSVSINDTDHIEGSDDSASEKASQTKQSLVARRNVLASARR